jgi:DNA-binding MarR family transcriptional regulator
MVVSKVRKQKQSPGDKREAKTMINTRQAAKTAAAGDDRKDAIRTLYMESLQLVELLHRRLLDVIKDEFDRSARSDINAIQALLLFNIGNSELTAGELRSRGYYLGSNVSYNLKKLVDLGFINHQRSRIDRRSVRVSLTPKGQAIAEVVAGLYERHIGSIEQVGGLSQDEFRQMNRALQRLDRFWNDTIAYRM